MLSNLYEQIPQDPYLSIVSVLETMVWWLAAATPCLFKCILSVLIQSVIMVVLTRSECNQARFKAVCNGNTMGELILFPIFHVNISLLIFI